MMDICPLCQGSLKEGESLQLHYFLCPANTENRGQKSEQKEDLSVRFRWAKVEPCVDRIVHLISSLPDSVTLHWSDTEGLYESALTKVPLGKYNGQLAVGGDIIPVNDFEVNKHSDTIYIIPTEEEEETPEMIEGESQKDIIDDGDDPVAELLASTSIPGIDGQGTEPHPDVLNQQPQGGPLSLEDDKCPGKSSSFELSPLYKELLQHQVIHGEPSWIPHSGEQSPTNSDEELDQLMTRTGAEEGPPHLTAQPANPEERHLKSPVPVRPISNGEERVHPDILPGTQGESTGDRGPGTRDIKGKDDHHGNRSPMSSSSYSGSSSKRSSERSSATQSPDITSDAANDALQEQSLEEAIPQDSPELQELPQPDDGTFLTEELSHDVPSQEKRSRDSPSGTTSHHSKDIPAGPAANSVHSNQSSARASPQSQRSVPSREDSVTGSRVSPVPPRHSLEEIPSGSRTQESTTSLPYPGSIQSPRRLIDEEHKSLLLSGHEGTPVFSPVGSARSSIRKRSSEDIRRPPLSGRDGTPPASSPLGSLHLLDQQRRHSDEIRSPLGSVHSSTHSLRGQSAIGSHGTLPGITSPAAISSLHSSARSTPRGSSPRLSPRRSLTEVHPGTIPQGDEQEVHDTRSRGSPVSSRGSLEFTRFSASRTPVDSRPAFSQERLGNQSPGSSAHSRSPARSHGSSDSHKLPSNRSLRDSFGNIRDDSPVFTRRPSGDERPRSSDKPRDYAHLGSGLEHDITAPGHSIPSYSSAFTPMNGDGMQLDINHNKETDIFRHEQELMSRERGHPSEDEVRHLKEQIEDLKQQLLSIETAAALSERDNQKSMVLEIQVASLEETVKKKDEEIASLRERCDELEKINQKMKEEEESLKTVNKLTYEDNSDLKAELSDMRRKTYGSPMRTYTNADQILNKTLRERVTQLEADKRELKQKYGKIKLELEQTKAEKTLSDFRLKKAKSETNLNESFDKYTSYTKPTFDKDIYDRSWTKTSSGLGSSSYSWSDNNFESAYKVGSNTTRDSGLTNGLSPVLSVRDTSSTRRDDHVTDTPLYSTSLQRRFRSSIDDDIDVISDPSEHEFDHRSAHAHDRRRTLSSESSNSSLLEYEYGTNIRVPYQPSNYSSRDTRVELRERSKVGRPRPHSYHADTRLTSDRPTHGDEFQLQSCLKDKDYSPTSRALDYGTRPARRGTRTFPSTAPYSTTLEEPKSPLLPFAPKTPKDIQLGMRVMVMRSRGNIGRGVVKYVGSLPEREGTYVGVELLNGDGKHDGTFEGRRFFKCKPNRGIFVRASKVIMCYPV